MIFVAIFMQDGSVKRMQCIGEASIEECIGKAPWASRVRSWRLAKPEEFPPNCRWQDVGGQIVGVPIVDPPKRDIAAELDALKAELAARRVINKG